MKALGQGSFLLSIVILLKGILIGASHAPISFSSKSDTLVSNVTKQDESFERWLKKLDRKPTRTIIESKMPTFDGKNASSGKTPNAKRQRNPTTEAKLVEGDEEESTKVFLRNAEFYTDATYERPTLGWRTFFCTNGSIAFSPDVVYKHASIPAENVENEEDPDEPTRVVVFPNTPVIRHRYNPNLNRGNDEYLVWSSSNKIYSIKNPERNARALVFPSEIVTIVFAMGRGEPIYLRADEKNIEWLNDDEFDLDDIRATYGWPNYKFNEAEESSIFKLMDRNDLDEDYHRTKAFKSAYGRILLSLIDQHVFATAEALLQNMKRD